MNVGKILNRGLWASIFFAVVAAIGVSSSINYKYGLMVGGFLFGAMFVVFGVCEVLLPVMGYKTRSRRHKAVANFTAMFLMLVSLITSVSTFQAGRMAAEQEQSGILERIKSSQADAEIAQQNLKVLVDKNVAAQADCIKQREINAKDRSRGYPTKACRAAESAQKAVNRATSDLAQYRRVSAKSADGVELASNKIYNDLASMLGGSAQKWEVAITIMVCIAIAGLAFVLMYVTTQVWEEARAREEADKAKREADAKALEEKQVRLEELRLERDIAQRKAGEGGDKPEPPKPSKKKPRPKPVSATSDKVVPFKKPEKTPYTQAKALIKARKIKPSFRGLTVEAKKHGLSVGGKRATQILDRLVVNRVIEQNGSRGYRLVPRKSEEGSK